jgi:hypothetical protein
MNKRKSYIWILGLSAAVLILSSCAMFSGRPPLATVGNPVQRATASGFRVTVRFLDEPFLATKYKKEENPFLTDYYSAQFRRIMVYELTLENLGNEQAQFFLNRVRLAYGAAEIEPRNQFQLNEYWKFKDETSNNPKVYIARRERIIKQTVLPHSYTLSANGIMKGYLVFLGNTPDHGEAQLQIPLFRTKNEEIHRFTFTYEY